MLAQHLERINCEVDFESDAESGLAKALSEKYDLIVLDRGLGNADGLNVCRKIRARNQEVRILMLTALADELDLVTGLESGADDYVAKPFRLAELMARVQVLLRRAEKLHNKSCLEFGDLSINLEQRKVNFGQAEVSLTAREFDILALLSARPGRVYTKEEIRKNVWENDVIGYEDSVTTLVKRLRKKLASPSGQFSYIDTVRGIGYRFVEDV